MALIDTIPDGVASQLYMFTFGDIPGMATFNFNPASSRGGFGFFSDTTLTSINAPNLVSIDPTSLQQGGLVVRDCPLTVLNVPQLQFIADVVLIQNTSLTAINFPALTTAGGLHGMSFVANASLTTLSLPLLTTVTGQIELDSMPLMTVLDLPSLFTIGDQPPEGGFVSVTGMTGLTTINLPVCQHIGGYFQMSGCTSLTTVNVPNWLPTNGTTISFPNSPLNVTSVNSILHQCVQSAGYTSGSVNVSGGAAPTGQGIADKATLQGRGVTVFTS